MSQFPEKKKITSEDNSVTTSGRAIPVGAHELRVVETSAILDVGGVHTHTYTHTNTRYTRIPRIRTFVCADACEISAC